MRKEDLIAGVRGKPTPLDVGGVAVHLRPLTSAERLDLLAWHKANKEEPGAAHVLQHKLVALAVVDPDSGGQLLSEADAAVLPALAVDAISQAVADRNGLSEGGAGKASRPTPN